MRCSERRLTSVKTLRFIVLVVMVATLAQRDNVLAAESRWSLPKVWPFGNPAAPLGKPVAQAEKSRRWGSDILPTWARSSRPAPRKEKKKETAPPAANRLTTAPKHLMTNATSWLSPAGKKKAHPLPKSNRRSAKARQRSWSLLPWFSRNDRPQRPKTVNEWMKQDRLDP
jgi:hypothetical protein